MACKTLKTRTELSSPMAQSSLSAFFVVSLLLAAFCAGCQSTPKSTSGGEVARDSKAQETDSEQAPDPDRPAPVLPPVAFFLGQYAALELTIKQGRMVLCKR
jgi:hypothetical protein